MLIDCQSPCTTATGCRSHGRGDGCQNGPHELQGTSSTCLQAVVWRDAGKSKGRRKTAFVSAGMCHVDCLILLQEVTGGWV